MSKYDCPHGLDRRKHARCYMCEPEAPLTWPMPGCQCPPSWLGTVPPPCPVHNPVVPTVTWPNTIGWGTSTVRCTCPPDRGDNYLGTCPIHDVQVTYTT